MRLTDEQREAVIEPGHVCLVSCPGSGKTRVIVAKLLRCIDAVAGTTRRVACITHTNAAADEIDCRLREVCFGNEDLYYSVCTIHGFALQNILRPYHHLLPEFQNGFSIITSNTEVYDVKAKELIKKYRLKAFAFEEFERIQRLADGSPTEMQSLPLALQQEWCQWLDTNAYVTLNEIVHHSGRIVSSHAQVASALASHFQWILVDEFQDSSPAQIRILKAIHQFKRTTFFCVGDPNQSIYRFAGASPELLLEFANHIQANTDHRLTGNFRSSAKICAVSERLCRSEPPMRAVGEYAGSPHTPVHRRLATPVTGIIGEFLPEVAKIAVPLGKVAILASWWMPLFALAGELRAAGIPCIGPGARPYKRTHIVSHFLEPVGAYVENVSAPLAIIVQRALFCLIADLTGHATYSIYSYRGRTVVCQILAAAKSARTRSGLAIHWISEVVSALATMLTEGDFITAKEAEDLRQSGNQMVADIRSRNGGDAFSVEALGIFARPDNCVQLLTVHKAKGREFDAVAVIEAHDGKFPHFSIADIADPIEREAQYAEGRRIVYVAATRAKRVLMFFTDTRDYRDQPSPFLAEMEL